MTEIYPCPFCMMDDRNCDEYPKIIYLDGFTFVSCGYCGADGPRISSTGKDCEQRAIEAWNEVEIVTKYQNALIEGVKIIRCWHGEVVFDIYYLHSPEMRPIWELLGNDMAIFEESEAE